LGWLRKTVKDGDGTKKTAVEEWQFRNRELVGLINTRRIDEAVVFGQDLVEYVDKKFKKYAPEKATTYNNMGMAFLLKKDYGMAEMSFFSALEIRKRLFGDDHNEVALIYLNLSQLYKIRAQEIMAMNPVATK
jgi:hypothetical protein